MNNIRNFWKKLWDEHANSDSMFVRVGFSKCYEIPINSKFWQLKYMLDFVGEK